MKRIHYILAITATTAILAGGALALPGDSDQIIQGQSAVISGGTASTWARVNGAGKVIWVGLTIPLSMAETMPPPGAGPAGAVAVLNYPLVVQQTTYFNHAEIQSNLHGHATNPTYAQPARYSEEHFDFHFYSIPVADVLAIPPGLFFTPAAADLLPAGWHQPEPVSVPQMGRHAAPLSEFTATDDWMATMIAGFMPNAGAMHFLEPMVTTDLLLSRQNFTLPIPRPAVLGRSIRYPTEFVAQYDRDLDAYHFVFKGFEEIE